MSPMKKIGFTLWLMWVLGCLAFTFVFVPVVLFLAP